MFDRFGLVPAGIRQDYEQEELVDRQLHQAHALAKALKAMDPNIVGITLFKADSPEIISTEHGPASIKPGRWHVQRQNDGPIPDSFIPIETPSGGYREPDFGVLHELQRRDLWKVTDPVPVREEEKPEPDMTEEMLSDFRAARRVPGEDVYKRRARRKG